VLISFASGKPKFRDPRLVILYPARGDLREVIEAVEEQGKGKKWKKMTRREYPVNQFEAAKWVELLRKEDADLILFFGIEPETREFLKEIQKANWTPGLLLPGVLMGKAVYEIPPALKDKVFISFPTLAEDRKEKGMREFMSLVQKYNLPTTHLGAQLSAYAAAQILLESLRRVGRDLSRERFIATLERMHEFDTGLTPLITFNPNRHIGALGAYVVTVDPGQQGKKEFISSQKWVNLD
jgi:ABC-type branched-subunit amino acid transport system substrate-binding protein